jgi:serine/threonine protein kinase
MPDDCTFQANILVTASGRACLADFGLAIVIDSQVNKYPPVESAGTPRWQAPELLQGDFGDVGHCNSSRESDIYAFACVCYEVIISLACFLTDCMTLVILTVNIWQHAIS